MLAAVAAQVIWGAHTRSKSTKSPLAKSPAHAPVGDAHAGFYTIKIVLYNIVFQYESYGMVFHFCPISSSVRTSSFLSMEPIFSTTEGLTGLEAGEGRDATEAHDEGMPG